ncbi:MAG: co-chaperone GroES [bacterium]
MDLQPLRNRVVLKQIEPEEETTEAGIVIPDTAQEEPQKAEVIAVGPGKQENGETIEPEVSDGDTVLYSKYAGTEVEVSGEEYLVLDAENVLAKIQ